MSSTLRNEGVGFSRGGRSSPESPTILSRYGRSHAVANTTFWRLLLSALVQNELSSFPSIHILPAKELTFCSQSLMATVFGSKSGICYLLAMAAMLQTLVAGGRSMVQVPASWLYPCHVSDWIHARWRRRRWENQWHGPTSDVNSFIQCPIHP